MSLLLIVGNQILRRYGGLQWRDIYVTFRENLSAAVLGHILLYNTVI